MTYQVGQKIHLGIGAKWEGDFTILEIVKTFANGKTAIRVNFYGKSKVFHV